MAESVNDGRARRPHSGRPPGRVDLFGLAARSPDVIYRYRFRPMRGFDFVNDAVSNVLGYTPAEHYADANLPFKLVHPDDLHLLIERGRVGSIPEEIVVRFRRRDGKTVLLELRESTLFDKSGHVVAIEGIARELRDARDRDAAVRVFDGVRIDLAEQSVHVDGKLVRLSPAEFKLLAYLTARPGKVVSRRELMRRLWRSSHAVKSHSCETHISALRRKIEREPRFPERIVTVRGRGYKYVVDDGAWAREYRERARTSPDPCVAAACAEHGTPARPVAENPAS